VRTVAELRAALRPVRRTERVIGLVPTMGALHTGHLSLIRRAREECDEVVVSLFVNPAQFDEPADLEAYPRDEPRDLALAAEEGADIVFAPAVDEVYPNGFSASVRVGGLSETLEGAHRGPGHFDGVTTVVTKLFNMVAPDIAYFGQKDAQQTVVIRRLVCDLDLPVRIEVCPTVREPDGLAMSSRNARLTPEQRRRAPALARGLAAAAGLAVDGERDAGTLVAAARAELEADAVAVEYLELVDAEDLRPVGQLAGRCLLLVAARLGSTRLIDNAVLVPASEPSLASPLPRPRTEQRCSV
jgi:pantoate--beta-alanine ligase